MAHKLRSEFQIIIIITRPKPAYGRQGLAGGSLRASSAQLKVGSAHFSLLTNKHFIIMYISMPPSAALSPPSSSSFHREAAEMQQLNWRKNSFQEFLGPLVPARPPVQPIRKSFLVFLCLLCPTTKSLSSHVSAGQAPRT